MLLNDKDEPKEAKSSTDNDAPSRHFPHTETADPKPAMLRNDSEAPRLKKSITDKVAPSREKLLSDTELPK
jgi:hypothetical protein